MGEQHRGNERAPVLPYFALREGASLPSPSIPRDVVHPDVLPLEHERKAAPSFHHVNDPAAHATDATDTSQLSSHEVSPHSREGFLNPMTQLF